MNTHNKKGITVVEAFFSVVVVILGLILIFYPLYKDLLDRDISKQIKEELGLIEEVYSDDNNIYKLFAGISFVNEKIQDIDNIELQKEIRKNISGITEYVCKDVYEKDIIYDGIECDKYILDRIDKEKLSEFNKEKKEL